MSVLLAMLGAVVYGVAVALQHHEAAASDLRKSLRPGLLFSLLARPLWLIGLAGDVGGFALQTAALALGSLVVVQPILTLALVVSLVVGARLRRTALTVREWLAVVGTLAGLSTFLVVAQPTEHSNATATTTAWLTMAAVVTGAILLTLAIGRAANGVRRAVLFALAAASAEALMAVVAKAFGDRIGRGVWSTFTSWQPYAVVVCGVLTLLLVQSAYQIGRATATLPVITVAEPIIAITIGFALFGEHIHVGRGRGPIVLLSLAVMIRSLMLIATRSAESDVATVVREGEPR